MDDINIFYIRIKGRLYKVTEKCDVIALQVNIKGAFKMAYQFVFTSIVIFVCIGVISFIVNTYLIKDKEKRGKFL
ncbi:hypothetical protein CN675_09100 [Bacillus toyonensis]|nr:hypothetical protein CN675_09100 [Bacillus toyonensis]